MGHECPLLVPGKYATLEVTIIDEPTLDRLCDSEHVEEEQMRRGWERLERICCPSGAHSLRGAEMWEENGDGWLDHGWLPVPDDPQTPWRCPWCRNDPAGFRYRAVRRFRGLTPVQWDEACGRYTSGLELLMPRGWRRVDFPALDDYAETLTLVGWRALDIVCQDCEEYVPYYLAVGTARSFPLGEVIVPTWRVVGHDYGNLDPPWMPERFSRPGPQRQPTFVDCFTAEEAAHWQARLGLQGYDLVRMLHPDETWTKEIPDAG